MAFTRGEFRLFASTSLFTFRSEFAWSYIFIIRVMRVFSPVAVAVNQHSYVKKQRSKNTRRWREKNNTEWIFWWRDEVKHINAVSSLCRPSAEESFFPEVWVITKHCPSALELMCKKDKHVINQKLYKHWLQHSFGCWCDTACAAAAQSSPQPRLHNSVNARSLTQLKSARTQNFYCTQ